MDIRSGFLTVNFLNKSMAEEEKKDQKLGEENEEAENMDHEYDPDSDMCGACGGCGGEDKKYTLAS